MAKSARQRAMPSTPQDRPPAPSPASLPADRPSSPPPARRPTTSAHSAEPEYLIVGTRCTSGHVRGQELDAGRLGAVPNRRRARIGFGLVLWCVAGMAFLAAVGITSWTWSTVGAQVAVLWLAFAAFVVRTSGHRKRCWRTRTWRHAWGGLAPGSGS
jgi:hypothetical protein